MKTAEVLNDMLFQRDLLATSMLFLSLRSQAVCRYWSLLLNLYCS